MVGEASWSTEVGGEAWKIKFWVLALLVVQNVATILLMKQASKVKATDGRQALSTSIVLIVEIVKVFFCVTEIVIRCNIGEILVFSLRWKTGL